MWANSALGGSLRPIGTVIAFAQNLFGTGSINNAYEKAFAVACSSIPS